MKFFDFIKKTKTEFLLDVFHREIQHLHEREPQYCWVTSSESLRILIENPNRIAFDDEGRSLDEIPIIIDEAIPTGHIRLVLWCASIRFNTDDLSENRVN